MSFVVILYLYIFLSCISIMFLCRYDTMYSDVLLCTVFVSLSIFDIQSFLFKTEEDVVGTATHRRRWCKRTDPAQAVQYTVYSSV